LHAASAVDVAFDEANLIADAGLVPVIALAEQIGLSFTAGIRLLPPGLAGPGCDDGSGQRDQAVVVG
jgi:hypothetical protein